MQTDTNFWRGIYVAIREHLKHPNEIYLYRFKLDSGVNLIKMYYNIKRKGRNI